MPDWKKRADEKISEAEKGKLVEIDKERQEARQAYHSEQHIKSGGYIREFILGFNDGLVSTFSLVVGVTGAAVGNKIVILAGLAGLAAGATSMGLNNYISSKSQIEFYQSEIKREEYEIETVPETERKEIVEIYKAKGFKGKILNAIVNKICSDKKIWLKVMMEEELGLFEDNFDSPVKIAIITGVSFILGAIIPIAPYFFISVGNALITSAVFSLLGLFIIGASKTFITKKNWLKSGLEMILIGIVASAAAYAIGKMFSLFY